MVQFKIESPSQGISLAESLFVPCHLVDGQLIAVTGGLLSDTSPEDEDSDHGFQVFWSREAAELLLNEFEKVYGLTPRWMPHVATLVEFVERSGDSAVIEQRRRNRFSELQFAETT